MTNVEIKKYDAFWGGKLVRLFYQAIIGLRSDDDSLSAQPTFIGARPLYPPDTQNSSGYISCHTRGRLPCSRHTRNSPSSSSLSRKTGTLKHKDQRRTVGEGEHSIDG